MLNQKSQERTLGVCNYIINCDHSNIPASCNYTVLIDCQNFSAPEESNNVVYRDNVLDTKTSYKDAIKISQR